MITQLWNADISIAEITRQVNAQGLVCSERSLERYLKSQGMRRNMKISELDVEVFEEIAEGFWFSRSDTKISKYIHLRNREEISYTILYSFTNNEIGVDKWSILEN
jgi:hypothetical protein